MPIVIAFDEGRSCPQVNCDYCGRQITDAKGGNFLYNPDDRPKPRVLFVHKGKCDWAFEHAHPRGGDQRAHLWSGSLLELPVYLSRNLDLEWGDPEAEAAADWSGNVV